jgi:two-component system LytT family sensor kinase
MKNRMKDASPHRRALRDWAIPVIALFWVAEYLIVTTVDHLASATAILFLPRALICGSGLVLSLAITRMRGVTGRTAATGWRIIALPAFALLGGFLQTSLNYGIFRLFAPEMRPQIDATTYLADTIHWFWIYAAQLGIVFSLDYSRAVADHERRIAVLDRLAHQAQLRALRYQLNPHFMFNTLNSIATLVRRGDAEVAEGMIEDLADFLRATLAVAPNEDITLSRELELQALYLAIETKRFPGRLRVEMDVSPESARAMVPSLITQPLTENVIRHAVAGSRASVLLSILARRVDDQLHLTIANSSPERGTDAKGMNVGLTNVAERLRVRFDGECSFSAGLQPDGGFAAEIHLPFVAAR